MAVVGLLGARYELGEVIGRGGMAEVRQGYDTKLGRVVAVKTLRADLATDPVFVERFRREARSAAALNHPSIVAIYDTGEQEIDGSSTPFLVMEYVEGRTLRDVLREGPLPPERALRIAAVVLVALAHSHRAGIVHRDIKPANVMLTPAGDVKVMDFGIARALADPSAALTQTAAMIGTAQYLSPEQAQSQPVDARGDIYAIGCVLYEMLTGQPPFVGDPVSVAYQHVQETPAPPSAHDPDVPPAVDAITLTALAKRPEDRYQDATGMRTDIEHVLAGRPIAGPPPSPPVTGPESTEAETKVIETAAPPGRRAGYVALAVLATLSMAGLIWGLVTVLGGDEPVDDLRVPQLVGQTHQQAEAKLVNAGFDTPRLVEDARRDHPEGIVVDQRPAQGRAVPPNTKVTLVVSTGPPTTTVPPVLGLDVDEARQLLEAQDFDVTTRKDEESDEEADIVTAVKPEEGASVPAGTKATLTYSAGLVAVPDVTDEARTAAEATLEAEGFDVAIEDQQTTDIDEGHVVTQTPEPGQRRPSGDTVTIVVAVAPEPVEPEEPNQQRPTEEPPDNADEDEGGWDDDSDWGDWGDEESDEPSR